MPRDGSGIYHRPAGTDGVPNFPIESAKYNTYIADVEQDLNTPRPIVAGGTGATTAAGAITNLGGEQSHQLVTNYDAMAWVSGSFYSAAGATSAPTANAFSGIVYVTDANNMVVEARDSATGGLYIRNMRAGTWSPWKLDNDLYFSDTAPPGAPDGSMWWETDSGILFVRYNDGTSTQWVPATPQPDLTLYVAKAGDTMTGQLLLYGDPVAPLGSATKQYVDNRVASVAVPMRGWIGGLTLSTVGGSNVFAVSVGEAADSTNLNLIRSTSVITKNTSNWAVGAAGGLDTGVVSINTWYHVYLIKRLDTGVVDVVFSLNATAPTLMPASYTLYRRLGGVFLNASLQWTKFVQLGDEFIWDVAFVIANNLAIPDTLAHTLVCASPLGVQVQALITGQSLNTTVGGDCRIYFSSLDKSDEVASGGNINAGTIGLTGSQSGSGFALTVRTDVNRNIRYRAVTSGGGTPIIFVSSLGWIDNRGRLA